MFTGVYTLVGASQTVGIDYRLRTDASGGTTSDFGHTATMALSLPSNVGFTSGSGVFLTSPVPEPGSMGLMLAGMVGLAGLQAWRRRQARGLG